MTWTMSGKPSVETITRKLAQQFADMEPAPGDRDLRQHRLSHLKTQFADCKFRTCEWASVFCRQTGKTYRVNGKHTSTLLTTLNGDFPKGLSVIIEHYECDTLDDVASLYSTFDNKSASRTQPDINKIFAHAHPDLSKLSANIINMCVAGINYAVCGIGSSAVYSSRTQEEKAHLLLEYPGFVCWVYAVTGGRKKGVSNFLFRGPVIAAMFNTYQKSMKASGEFWIAVKDGTGPKPTNPDRKLQKYLLVTTLSRSCHPSDKQYDNERAMYSRCIHAWNAWRKDESTDLKYFPQSKLPVAV